MEEWVIAFIGGIIGSAITFIVGIFTLRFNYRQLYAQTVSSTREKWLCILRENLSKYISCAEILNYGKLNFCKKSSWVDNNSFKNLISVRKYDFSFSKNSLYKIPEITKKLIKRKNVLTKKIARNIFLLIIILRNCSPSPREFWFLPRTH